MTMFMVEMMKLDIENYDEVDWAIYRCWSPVAIQDYHSYLDRGISSLKKQFLRYWRSGMSLREYALEIIQHTAT